MNTDSMREEAGVMLAQAQEAINKGNVDEGLALKDEAVSKMEKAKQVDEAQAIISAQKVEFSTPQVELPVASTDVAKYDPTDQTRKIKADYKPASYVKGLPPAAQPLYVQELMGDDHKEAVKHYKNAFIKYMTAPDVESAKASWTPDERKAMQEDTDTEGGYFVPEEFINQVIHDPGLPTGELRAACTSIRVAPKDGYVPTLASATWAAIAEEAAFSDQTPTVGQVPFSVEKSGGLIKVTSELLDDSAVNLPALLSQIFQEASGRFEDAGILNGNNTTNYAGILQGSSSDYVMANATSVTAADLFGIFYTLQAQHRGNATWVMNSLISKEINNINATSAGVHSVNDLNTAPAEFLLGKRVINSDVSGNGLADSITAGDEIAVFGDFRNYYIFDRIGFQIRRNDSLYMENDQIGFFATRRGDGQVGLADAFKIMKAAP